MNRLARSIRLAFPGFLNRTPSALHRVVWVYQRFQRQSPQNDPTRNDAPNDAPLVHGTLHITIVKVHYEWSCSKSLPVRCGFCSSELLGPVFCCFLLFAQLASVHIPLKPLLWLSEYHKVRGTPSPITRA